MQTMLLVEKVHLSFEAWFIKLFREGVLAEDEQITLAIMRKEYMALCWKEEMLWNKWKELVNAKE